MANVITAKEAIAQGTSPHSIRSIITWCRSEIKKAISADRHFAKKDNRPPNKNIKRVNDLNEQINQLKAVADEMEEMLKKEKE